MGQQRLRSGPTKTNAADNRVQGSCESIAQSYPPENSLWPQLVVADQMWEEVRRLARSLILCDNDSSPFCTAFCVVHYDQVIHA